MANTTADKLALAAANKTAIKAAINAKSPATAPTDVMSQWPTAIASIPSGPSVQVDALSVVANGTYTAASGHAYSPVTVNVPTDTWDENYLTIKYDCQNILSASLTFSFASSYVSSTVDWGDGNTQSFSKWTTVRHTYAARGIYTIKIAVTNTFNFNDHPFNDTGIVEVWLPPKFEISDNGYNVKLFAPYSLVHVPQAGTLGTYPPFGASVRYANGVIYLNYTSFKRYYQDNVTVNADLVFTAASFSAAGHSQYGGTASGIRFIRFTRCTDITIGSNDYWSGTFSKLPTLVAFLGVNTIKTTTSADRLFYGNSSMQWLPDTLDMSAATSATDAFYGCAALRRLPSHVTANVSLSFAPCTAVADKQSVLDFANNINTCTNSGQTITFNSAIKTLLGDDYAAVETTLTAKNWTVAW